MSFSEFITFIYVSDLRRAHSFYTDAFGLEQVLDQGGCRIYRVVGDAYVGICERPDQVNPGSVILTFVTDEVDEWHARALAAGGLEEKAPAVTERYGIYNSFVRDADGYLVEVQRFLDPEWAAPDGS